MILKSARACLRPYGLSVIIVNIVFMKKWILSLALAISQIACLSAAGPVYAPRTSWPYVYEEFIPGKIKTHKGTDISYDKLNISLANGRVHYVEKGVIMQADINSIALLTIGDDSYVCVEGRMAKVLRNTVNSAVLLRTTIDTEAMSSADIGYGKSSVASTNNLSATALGSGMDFSVNRSLDDVLKERQEGEPLVLQEVKGIYYKGSFVPAARVDVLRIQGIDKEAVKQYIKKEKIKFGSIDDLAALADYLYTL